MKIVIKASQKEIAALMQQIQGQLSANNESCYETSEGKVHCGEKVSTGASCKDAQRHPFPDTSTIP